MLIGLKENTVHLPCGYLSFVVAMRDGYKQPHCWANSTEETQYRLLTVSGSICLRNLISLSTGICYSLLRHVSRCVSLFNLCVYLSFNYSTPTWQKTHAVSITVATTSPCRTHIRYVTGKLLQCQICVGLALSDKRLRCMNHFVCCWTFQPWKWKQNVPTERWTVTRLREVTQLKTECFIKAGGLPLRFKGMNYCFIKLLSWLLELRRINNGTLKVCRTDRRLR
jgi:hypothetical protein